jgi:hypothetical protein
MDQWLSFRIDRQGKGSTMTSSFLPDQLKPVQPKEKPIVHGSNVRHRDPPLELGDASGTVQKIKDNAAGPRKIGVSWKVEGKLLPEQWHDESELENVD